MSGQFKNNKMKRAEIKANRLKFAKGLQEPNREKHTGELEDINNPNARCCLGHGCQIFGMRRRVKNESVYYGTQRNISPPKLTRLLGMKDDCGSANKYNPEAYIKGTSYSALTVLNDGSTYSTQEIGVLIEGWIEGGDGTPFKALSDYKD